jgi:RsiW-degrading membrane proteinase PrsW (M82 family)
MVFNAFVYALIAGLLPSLLWLFFFIHEDNAHKRHLVVILGCFLGGMLAVILAIPIEQYLSGIFPDQDIRVIFWNMLSSHDLRYILWAATEECLKFIAVVLIAFHARTNEEPIDAMIYCATVALGFAAVENALFIMGPLSSGAVSQAIVTGNMRFIGATLVHVVSSSLVGFALGYAFYHRSVAKFFAVIVGLAGAIALHSAFNLSIINASSAGTLKTFGWVWGAVVIVIILFEEIKAVHPRFV